MTLAMPGQRRSRASPGCCRRASWVARDWSFGGEFLCHRTVSPRSLRCEKHCLLPVRAAAAREPFATRGSHIWGRATTVRHAHAGGECCYSGGHFRSTSLCYACHSLLSCLLAFFGESRLFCRCCSGYAVQRALASVKQEWPGLEWHRPCKIATATLRTVVMRTLRLH